jgi:copper chaperone|tara:strand:+ start:713 stop:922 length:210 start_codon:yes stop_codon:yes gene_type:complete
MKKITLEVNGMTCDHCVQTIKGTLNKIIGLNLIEINLDKSQVKVEFNESQTNIKILSGEIVALGFEVKK